MAAVGVLYSYLAPSLDRVLAGLKAVFRGGVVYSKSLTHLCVRKDAVIAVRDGGTVRRAQLCLYSCAHVCLFCVSSVGVRVSPRETYQRF